MNRRNVFSAIAGAVTGLVAALRSPPVEAAPIAKPSADLSPSAKPPFVFSACPFYSDGRPGDPDNARQIGKFLGWMGAYKCPSGELLTHLSEDGKTLAIETPKGVVVINHGDWVIMDLCGDSGVSYCSANAFEVICATTGSSKHYPIADVSAMPFVGDRKPLFGIRKI